MCDVLDNKIKDKYKNKGEMRIFQKLYVVFNFNYNI